VKYAISDIHGCSKTLTALLNQLPITSNDTIYFLGDYIDRGPDSKGVLDIIMSTPNAVCHKGNHEDMALRAIAGEGNYAGCWISNGGMIALESFGGNGIPDNYINFMNSLKLITELDDFYLCHAGIGWDAMNTPEEMLLWDRDCEVDIVKSGGRRLICGHTPQTLEEIEDNIFADKVIIDAGCVFKDYGNLVALRLDDMRLFVQPNVER